MRYPLLYLSLSLVVTSAACEYSILVVGSVPAPANLTYVRNNTPASTRWTIGPPAQTNLIGHAVVVHTIDPGTARHACGVIEAVN